MKFTQKGLSVFPLVLLLGAAVLSASLFYANFYSMQKKSSHRMVYHQNILSFNQTLTSLLRSPNALLYTAKHDTNSPKLWDCMSNPNIVPTCDTLTHVLPNIYDDSGTPLTLNLGLDGNPCASGTSCPFQFQVTWQAECPTSALCQAPPDLSHNHFSR